MTTIAMKSPSHSRTFGIFRNEARATWLDLSERFGNWRQYRRSIAELRQFSREQLFDLDIALSDIGRIAS